MLDGRSIARVAGGTIETPTRLLHAWLLEDTYKTRSNAGVGELGGGHNATVEFTIVPLVCLDHADDSNRQSIWRVEFVNVPNS